MVLWLPVVGITSAFKLNWCNLNMEQGIVVEDEVQYWTIRLLRTQSMREKF
jgi:hypothetical protein